jgi:hypothetical protein
VPVGPGAGVAAVPLYEGAVGASCAATAGSSYGMFGYAACCDVWTFSTEAMFLRRSDADQLQLITHQETGATLADAENLEFDHQGIARYRLVRDTSSCWGVELVYFGIDSWNTTAFGGGDVSPILQAPGFEFPSTAHGTVYQVGYGTDLYNGEVNLRRKVQQYITLVAGFRWIELRDDYRGRTVVPDVENFFAINTNNHMYGFQLGADTVLLTRGSLRLEATGRAGVMANNADQATQAPVLSPFVPAVADNIMARADHTAFVGEIGLRGAATLVGGLSVTAGYTAMWLDGLALAPDQIPVSSLNAPAWAWLDTGGTLLMHGAVVGLEASF